MSRFQVDCPSCQVSYPPETRRCMYCEQRLGRSFFASPDEPPSEVTELAEIAPDAANGEAAPRSPLRALTTAMWILVALLGSLYRVCTG